MKQPLASITSSAMVVIVALLTMSMHLTLTAADTMEELHAKLLYDIMHQYTEYIPTDTNKCPDSSDTTTFTDEWPGANQNVYWDPTTVQNYEEALFQTRMTHTDTTGNGRSWEVRFGTGGNIYSLYAADLYGEAMPPQAHVNAPWVDEVHQLVSVNQGLNNPNPNCQDNPQSCYFIHQAGAYPVDIDEYDDESLEFYNLQVNSRSPSPAFLLDSLGSVQIDPRAFGGSSGFGRGQWIEPRRSPLPARSVVFIAGDNVSTSSNSGFPTVKDRCDAARAAGCRVIYLENLDDTTQHLIEDDSLAISLCDAIIDSFGNDNPRDIQPITLDAVSTPGDYWLNPPNPRDDKGNAVSVDELVEWFRSERESNTVEDTSCVAEEVNQEMSEDEMAIILADMDGL